MRAQFIKSLIIVLNVFVIESELLKRSEVFVQLFGLFLSLWWTFGTGTRLEFGSVSAPKVIVLPPSSEEISSKKTATLMCVASNGFPSDWSLSWKVNGKMSGSQENRAGVLQKDGGLYSWSSSLTLTEQEWINRDSVICEISREGQTVTGEVKKDLCSE
ncbi:Ig lambda-2 chain C region [Paramisgurnus dabryanus]|uniref:Ig lambda-2 chain C region n=1 Tax=Paramisgurnus dabryanus TaxID=90735 RepID=UPI003CCF1103